MRPVRRGISRLAALSLAAVLAACDGGTDPVAVDSITITSSTTELTVGATTQLTVTLRDAEGNVLENRTVTFESSDSDVATVSGTGLVTAVAPGTARIDATAGGVTSSRTFTISAPACDADSVEGTISLGSTVAGSIEASDCLLLEAAFADAFELELTGTTIVEVTLTSSEFDTFVLISDDDFNFMFGDDDGADGTGTDSRTIARLEPGTYHVWAMGFDEEEVGAYELTVEVTDFEFCAGPVGTLEVGDVVSDAIDSGSCLVDFGGFVFLTEPWSFEPATTVTVQIDLMSDEFDPVLVVADDAGEVIDFNDDAPNSETLNSQLTLTLAAGSYTIHATSFFGAESGAYDLSVVSAAAAASPRERPGFDALRPLAWPHVGGKKAGGR